MDKGKQNLSSLQTGLVILGLLGWGIAGLVYSSAKNYETVEKAGASQGASPAVAIAPNTKAGLGALGFAIAGGLCFLGAAIAELAHKPATGSEFPAAPAASGPLVTVAIIGGVLIVAALAASVAAHKTCTEFATSAMLTVAS
jgi:hypothetical protein